jgi:hypothetical protein
MVNNGADSIAANHDKSDQESDFAAYRIFGMRAGKAGAMRQSLADRCFCA